MGFIPWVVPVTIELLNWGDLYRNLRKRVPEGKLAQFLVDRNGVQHSGSLPPGMSRLDV